MKKLFTPPKGRILLLVLMLCLGFTKVQADDSGLITEQIKINVGEAGTLCDRIKSDLKYKITSLKLSGKLNIDDIQYIREMAGCYYDTNGSKYDGHLEELDLKDASFVSSDHSIQVYKGHVSNDAYSGDGHSVGRFAFSFLPCLKKIILPDNVKNIESYAFKGCTDLSFLELPSSLTSIGRSGFYECTGLTTISLPAGLEYMYGAFGGNIGLTSIYANMPTPLQDAYSFYGLDKSNCYLYVPKGSLDAYRQDEEWGRFPYIAGLEQDPATGLVSLDICPNGYRDYELIDAAMRDKVKSLKISGSGAVNFDFITQYLSRNLQNLDLKDANVTDLPYCGLDGCQALTTISLPAGLRSIDKGFLSLCRNLKTIYAYMPDPNALTYVDNFYYESREWTLYVPKGTKNAYQNSEAWSYCKEIIEMETSGIDSVILNPDAKEVSRFSADGQRLAVPVKGLNIVKYSDGSARKVVVK